MRDERSKEVRGTRVPSMHNWDKIPKGGTTLGTGEVTLGLSGYCEHEKAQEIRKRVKEQLPKAIKDISSRMVKGSSIPSMHSYSKFPNKGAMELGNGKRTLGLSGYMAHERARDLR
jgi:hypothetical protein